jgi:large subunit ribosomal protein L5
VELEDGRKLDAKLVVGADGRDSWVRGQCDIGVDYRSYHQRAIVTKAKKSIATFKVREGNPIGAKVTLRGERMWDFLERLTRVALPRIRDVRGVSGKSFDGRGNYTLGMKEQLSFPEVEFDKIDRLRGLEVTIVTTAKSDEESKKLLSMLGMPFAN